MTNALLYVFFLQNLCHLNMYTGRTTFIQKWKTKCTEEDKQKLVKEIREVLRGKEDIVDLEVTTVELRNYVEQLGKQSGIACQSEKMEVGPKQRTRKLKVLKERAECALWFAKSFGPELV